MKILLSVLLLLSTFSLGQAPIKATTCIQKDGKPCPLWLHKMIGQYPPLPNAPLPPRIEPATFWTFRTFDQPVLRTNKQVLRSKLFWLVNGAYVVSVVVDVQSTHGIRESADSEYPVIPVIFGMDYLMDRFVSRSFSVEAPIYGIVHYTKDALK